MNSLPEDESLEDGPARRKIAACTTGRQRLQPGASLACPMSSAATARRAELSILNRALLPSGTACVDSWTDGPWRMPSMPSIEVGRSLESR